MTKWLGCLLVLVLSWYAMEAVHELGHVLHAVVSGGTVQSVSVPLWGISCTHVEPNPHPAFVVWGGPAWGVLLPVLLWAGVRLWKAGSIAARGLMFFAGFCCLANGAYLGIGWVDRVGDAGDLLREGVAPGWLVLFGVCSSAGGLWLWHLLTLELRTSNASGTRAVSR
ncbi:hypothetical protein [Rubinisphaera margarita]|uniref:hypothetical protein n=1 Tax=Rubinisphaera margarita TaxID=2909586 RepID=UPI001EE7DD40|nr:hypothetical protein [Rubinisphaera margarita]MCG6157142.1 hypothetical protein [Rubinisphaera margarita]